MELKVSISGKQESERLLSIIQLGLVSALEKEIISIEEAEGYLFSPYTVEKLEKIGLSENIIEVIRKGCELEDIESLIPDQLLPTIISLKEEILSNMSASQRPSLPTEKIIK